jgi:hypothetical protein
VLKQPDRFAACQEKLTVFDSTGWALEDQVAMEVLMDFASELGIGQRVALETVSDDPKDPFGFLTDGCPRHSESHLRPQAMPAPAH